MKKLENFQRENPNLKFTR